MNALVELSKAPVTHKKRLYHFTLTKIIAQVMEYIKTFLFTSGVKAKLVKDMWGWEEPSFERLFLATLQNKTSCPCLQASLNIVPWLQTPISKAGLLFAEDTCS